MLSYFSHVQLFVTLWTVAQQASLSTGILQARILRYCQLQVHSKYDTVIYMCVLCLVAQSCLTFCEPMDCSLPGSSLHGDSPGRNTGVGCHIFFFRFFSIVSYFKSIEYSCLCCTVGPCCLFYSQQCVNPHLLICYPLGLSPLITRSVFCMPHAYSFSFFNFLFYIGVQLINNVVLVSGLQSGDSVIHIHVSVLFQILSPFRLLQNIEFPVLYNRSLLVIYFKYNSVYTLIPTS